MTEHISTDFTRSELTFSTTAIRHGIVNEPAPEQWFGIESLVREILQPMRLALGPVRVNSCYRCPELNAIVGGSPTSQHMALYHDAAADIRLVSQLVPLADVMAWIWRWCPYDQIIYEFGSWIHVSHRSAGPQRGEVLQSKRSVSGKIAYAPYDVDDLKLRIA